MTFCIAPFLLLPCASFLLSLSLHPFLLPLFHNGPQRANGNQQLQGERGGVLGWPDEGVRVKRGHSTGIVIEGAPMWGHRFPLQRLCNDVHTPLAPLLLCTPPDLLLPCGSLWPCYSLALRGQDSRGLIKWYQVLAREKCPPHLFSPNSHQQQTVPPLPFHTTESCWDIEPESESIGKGGCACHSKNKLNVQGMPSLCLRMCVSVTGFIASMCMCLHMYVLHKTATTSRGVGGGEVG